MGYIVKICTKSINLPDADKTLKIVGGEPAGAAPQMDDVGEVDVAVVLRPLVDIPAQSINRQGISVALFVVE